jgi:hypothetical protein
MIPYGYAFCQDCNDSISKKAYYDAFSNNSTSPDYIVFVAVDMQRDISKEICCESKSLIRAFREDHVSGIMDTATFLRSYKEAIDMYDSILISQPCKYTFHFKTSASLDDIGFYDYNSDSLDYYNKHSGAIIDSIKINYDPDKRILLKEYSNNQNLYLMHVLFKNGILCGRQCVSGYITIREILK